MRVWNENVLMKVLECWCSPSILGWAASSQLISVACCWSPPASPAPEILRTSAVASAWDSGDQCQQNVKWAATMDPDRDTGGAGNERERLASQWTNNSRQKGGWGESEKWGWFRWSVFLRMLCLFGQPPAMLWAHNESPSAVLKTIFLDY